MKKSKVITCHNSTFYIIAELSRQWHLWSCPRVQQYRSQHSARRNEALVYMLLQIIDCKWQNHVRHARWRRWSACEVGEATKRKGWRMCRAPSFSSATSHPKWAGPFTSLQLRHTSFPTLTWRCFSYVTGISPTSPDEPPMDRMQFHDKESVVQFWLQVTGT